MRVTEFEPRWQDQAACKGVPTEFFYPGADEAPYVIASYCRGCPVRNACLDEAITNGETHGIWGGTTWEQRRNLQRRQKRAAA